MLYNTDHWTFHFQHLQEGGEARQAKISFKAFKKIRLVSADGIFLA